ncbi:DNA topoisomerase I [Candidatus Woesearchaeota archaeon]|jgi:DNA topoisomerase-1|nr:DNA topoisomerase I [Candidatus Woesearchaeota archaeon]|tara:strand:- start:22123 stop:24336 length:2214 start_codon:yes stop_codon:yes gene_type:complete
MYELIITEKPAAAKKLAESLADGKPIKENNQGVPYYKVTHGNRDIVVACAVGHLYGLAEREKKGWSFPVFDIEWKPVSETSKSAAFTKKYLNTIKKLSKNADSFTVACDYDQEGEVIGLNVVRYVCKQKDASRMKFSTLTKPDLVKAYENKSKHIDWSQAEAGETRHFLDFYNGINYSRALTAAIKSTGAFKIMSTGRVQGPALKIIVDREKEIKAFKPVPFWQIQLTGEHSSQAITAWHKQDKFWEKEKADEVIKKTKGQKEALVEKIERKQFNQMAPFPFDLTSLQIEAYRCFRISPKETLQIGQELYTSGFISYPRTSSQQLPASIGYQKILKDLSKQKQYSDLVKLLLKKSKLSPNNGKKTDPAHPAIFPTGIPPQGLNERESKIYDLIVKRFFSSFAENAVRETMIINLDCNEEIFIAKGTRTIEKGWHRFYEPYVNLEEVELPHLKQNDKIDVKKIELLDKETQPPKRYTPASIIKALEKKNLGTKATRSDIIETLFQRGYVHGKAIEATGLGISTIETLEKYCPKIIDEELTRHFEIEMEKIRQNQLKKEKTLEESKDSITKIIADFKKNQKEIGAELAKANRETQDEMAFLGSCPTCKEGKLMLRRGKFGAFCACNRYPDCKTIFSIPKNALIKAAKKDCETCGYPKVLAIKRAKRPSEFCLNPKCPSKHVEGEAGKQAKAIAKGDVKRKCPKCNEGDIVLRSSIYGKFFGCSKYPKCRHTEKLENKSE